MPESPKLYLFLIRVRFRTNNTLEVGLRSTAGESKEIPTDIGLAQLKKHRQDFNSDLDKFQKKIIRISRRKYGLEISDNDVLSVLRELREIGDKLFDTLFNINRYTIEEFFQSSWPGMGVSDAPAYAPPLVIIDCRPEYTLPWEFFPVAPNPTGREDKMGLASSLLGFSTIVKRMSSDTCPEYLSRTTHRIENNKKLALRFFQNAYLDAARVERENLSHEDWIDFRGPWPSEQIGEEQFVQQLVEQLQQTGRHFAEAGAEDGPDHIHHFACHCYTDNKERDATKHLLELAHEGKGVIAKSARRMDVPLLHRRRVTIEQLRNEVKKYGESLRATPVIFLNACGSSKITPEMVESFPAFFLRRVCYGAFIGTETSVPDAFASEFSKWFYLFLIRGNDLGQALRRARMLLLKHCNNPLGILYTIYGNSNIRVSKKRKDAAYNQGVTSAEQRDLDAELVGASQQLGPVV